MPSLEAKRWASGKAVSRPEEGVARERWGEAGRAFSGRGTVCGRGIEGRGKWGHISGGDWRVAFTRDCMRRNGCKKKQERAQKTPQAGEEFCDRVLTSR